MQIRIQGDAALPVLIYLPGLHGDGTLVTSFRGAVSGKVRFVELAYPRTASASLEEYAAAVVARLKESGIEGGWLLAESFGSQVAWAVLNQGFFADGLILAGGFVRYPFPWGLRRVRSFCGRCGTVPLRAFLWCYRRYARLRHRNAPETLASIDEFVRNRMSPGDREAMTHRLDLIAASDPRPVAAATRIPVYSLTGFWDPIVFWGPVHRWLKTSCPAFRRDRVLFLADHNVLATQPVDSAGQILTWMRDAGLSA